MTSRELYNRFTRLCERWPKDETKIGRDYAEFFRIQINKYFPHGAVSQVADINLVDSKISSLERIVSNKYYNETTLKKSSASGLEAWACRAAASNEGLKAFDELNEDFLLNKMKKALSIKFTPLPDSEKEN